MFHRHRERAGAAGRSSRPGTATTQQALRADLVVVAAGLIARARDLARDLTPADLEWHPPAGGWSIGEVFEHLVIANEGYLNRMRPLARATGPVAPRDARWRPSVAGGLLVRSFASPRRLPAPRSFRPTARPRAAVITAFVATLEELTALMESAAALDWRRLRTTSPISRLVRVNLGDCFAIVVRHAERHFRQIDRVRAALRAAPQVRSPAQT